MRRVTTPWLCRSAILWPLLLCACGEQTGASFSGYAEGEYVRLAPPLPGTLVKLGVRRGDQAVQGAPAYVLEDVAEAAARSEAQSRVARAESVLADLRKGARADELAAIEAELKAAQAALALSRATLARDRELLRSRFIAPSRVDGSAAAVAADRARVDGIAAAGTCHCAQRPHRRAQRPDRRRRTRPRCGARPAGPGPQ